MKKLITGGLLLISTLAFAQSNPQLNINDELFRGTVNEAFEKSEIKPYLRAETVIDVQAYYNNKMCELDLKITSPSLNSEASFSMKTRNLKKCKAQISKFIKKEILFFK